jgi:hypothetical protein
MTTVEEDETMQKTYRGSCHCGAVRFETELDLAAAITSRCNCSICRRQRFWKTLVKAETVRITAGEDALTDYQWGGRNIHHLFCKTCGVKPFGRVHLDLKFGDVEMRGEYVAINLMVLDASDEEHAEAAARVRFEDGRNNDYVNPPAITSYL